MEGWRVGGLEWWCGRWVWGELVYVVREGAPDTEAQSDWTLAHGATHPMIAEAHRDGTLANPPTHPAIFEQSERTGDGGEVGGDGGGEGGHTAGAGAVSREGTI